MSAQSSPYEVLNASDPREITGLPHNVYYVERIGVFPLDDWMKIWGDDVPRRFERSAMSAEGHARWDAMIKEEFERHYKKKDKKQKGCIKYRRIKP